MWKLHDDSQCLTEHSFKNAVMSGCFTSISTFAAAMSDGTVKLWDLESGSVPCSIKGRPNSVINSVTRLSDRAIAFGGDDGVLRIADISSGNVERQLRFRFPITTICSKRGTMFVGLTDGTVRIIDCRSLVEELVLAAHSDIVTSVRCHPTSRVAATTGMDNMVKLWDVSAYSNCSESQVKLELPVDHGGSRTLIKCCWSPDGLLACGGAAGRVVTIDSNNTCRSTQLELSTALSIAFTPRGLCVGFQNGKVVVEEC